MISIIRKKYNFLKFPILLYSYLVFEIVISGSFLWFFFINYVVATMGSHILSEMQILYMAIRYVFLSIFTEFLKIFI